MKSIVIRQPREVVFEENPMPKPGEGEALLKILYGGICGSDLGSYRGTFAYSIIQEYRAMSFPRKSWRFRRILMD